MIKLYTDAATKGNPGPSSAGILIINQQKQFQFQTNLPVLSNHAAEFLAVQRGLEQIKALKLSANILQINVDSQIVYQSLEKNYAKHYQAYVDQINALLTPFELVLYQWIPEKQNQGAHHLAQQALNKQLAKK